MTSFLPGDEEVEDRRDDWDKYLKLHSSDDERKDVVDDESAKKFIDNSFLKDPSLKNLVGNMRQKDYDFIIKGQFMQQILERGKTDAVNSLGQALRLENKRPTRARRRDEMRTAKDTRAPNSKNIQRWARAPNRSDIRGVDTKRTTPGKFRVLTPKVNFAKHFVRSVRTSTKGTQHYVFRSLSTGRFMKSPSRKK